MYFKQLIYGNFFWRTDYAIFFRLLIFILYLKEYIFKTHASKELENIWNIVSATESNDLTTSFKLIFFFELNRSSQRMRLIYCD